MSRFNVGDIIVSRGSTALYKVTSTFEDFCQAKTFGELDDDLVNHYRRHAIKTITVDDFKPYWEKVEEIPINKFKLKEKIFFTIDNYSHRNNQTVSGKIVGVMGQLLTSYKPDSAGYFYIIEEIPDGTIHVAKEETVFKNINHNQVWNSLVENSN
jgi:hypothetical protein